MEHKVIERKFRNSEFLKIIWVKKHNSSNELQRKTLETIFGNYSCNIERIDQSTLKYTRTLRINDGTYPKEKYEEYRQFMSKIRPDN